MSAYTFSPHAFRCTVCFRLAFATVEAIQQTRESAMLGEEVSDAEIASQFEFCVGCVDGDPRPEGYVSQARMVAIGRIDRHSSVAKFSTTLLVPEAVASGIVAIEMPMRYPLPPSVASEVS